MNKINDENVFVRPRDLATSQCTSSNTGVPFSQVDTNVMRSQDSEVVSWSENFYEETQNHPTYTQTDLSYTQILSSDERRRNPKRPKLTSVDDIFESSDKINHQFEQLSSQLNSFVEIYFQRCMKFGIHKEALEELEKRGLSHCIQNHIGIQKLLLQEEQQQVQKPTFLPPFQIPRHIKLPFLVKNVTNKKEDWTEFIKLWERRNDFAWSLVYTVPEEFSRNNTNEEHYFLPKLCRVDGLFLCWSDIEVFFISLEDSSELSKEEKLSTIKRLFLSRRTKVQFEIKPQLKMLLELGIDVIGPFHDPKIFVWLRDPDEYKDPSLRQLVEEYLYESVPSVSTHYEDSALRAQMSWMIYCKFIELLPKEMNFRSLFQLEMMLIPVFVHMEHRGIGFSNVVEQETIRVNETLKALEMKAHKVAGYEFNLNEISDIQDILYKKLKIPFMPELEKSFKKFSTDQNVLSRLCSFHPLPGIILQHRKLTTLKTRYLDILSKHALYDPCTQMTRIYATILQTSASTGRVSVVDPNLQTTARPISYIPASELNKERPESVTIAVRECFISCSGYILLSADYSQLEMRVLSHLSKDPLLIQFLKSGGDIFKLIAAHWLQKEQDNVTFEERDMAKKICYGTLYGQGPVQLGILTGLSQLEAKNLIQSFQLAFPGIQDFLQSRIEEARKTKSSRSLFKIHHPPRESFFPYPITNHLASSNKSSSSDLASGRIRKITGIVSNNATERHKAERQAMNTVSQGSAADIVKKVMVDIFQLIRKKQYKAYMLVQMHDELLFEVKIEELNEVAMLVKMTMEKTNLDVETPVKLSVGSTWGSMKPYTCVT